MVTHTCANVVTHDSGFVAKPLCITVKTEAGNVVETSGEIDVVKPQATREIQKGVIAPEPPKWGPKKNLNFLKFETSKFSAWCLRRCW